MIMTMKEGVEMRFHKFHLEYILCVILLSMVQKENQQ